MNKSVLTPLAIADLNHILSDEVVKRIILRDEEKNIQNSKLKLNKDGSIVTGQTPWDWVNRLFGSYNHIPFEMVILKIFDGLFGHEHATNKDAKESVYRDFLNERFGNNNRNEIVEMVFSFYRFGFKTGFFEQNQNVFEDWVNKRERCKEPADGIPIFLMHDGLGIRAFVSENNKKRLF